MTGPELIDIARDGLMTYARVAGPLMIVILMVGVLISWIHARSATRLKDLVKTS